MAKKSKSPIDSKIIDLILEHFNTQSFRGNKEVLTGNEFMKLVDMYGLPDKKGKFYEPQTIMRNK